MRQPKHVTTCSTQALKKSMPAASAAEPGVEFGAIYRTTCQGEKIGVDPILDKAPGLQDGKVHRRNVICPPSGKSPMAFRAARPVSKDNVFAWLASWFFGLSRRKLFTTAIMTCAILLAWESVAFGAMCTVITDQGGFCPEIEHRPDDLDFECSDNQRRYVFRGEFFLVDMKTPNWATDVGGAFTHIQGPLEREFMKVHHLKFARENISLRIVGFLELKDSSSGLNCDRELLYEHGYTAMVANLQYFRAGYMSDGRWCLNTDYPDHVLNGPLDWHVSYQADLTVCIPAN